MAGELAAAALLLGVGNADQRQVAGFCAGFRRIGGERHRRQFARAVDAQQREPAVPVVGDAHGIAPLPQYIKYSPLTRAQAKREYQTIFAKKAGSVAARHGQ